MKLDGDESSRFERFSFVDRLFLRCFILIFSELPLLSAPWLSANLGCWANLYLLVFAKDSIYTSYRRGVFSTEARRKFSPLFSAGHSAHALDVTDAPTSVNRRGKKSGQIGYLLAQNIISLSF